MLWRSTWMLQRTLSSTPDWTNWSGYMLDVFLLADNSSSVDHINILPFIDMNARDNSCIFLLECVVYCCMSFFRLRFDFTTFCYQVMFERNLPQTALSKIMSHHRNKEGSRSNVGPVTKQPDGKFIREVCCVKFKYKFWIIFL